jgi:sugar/nucleoside kinase (ribokinase family)
LGPDGHLRVQGSLRVAQADILSTVGAGDAFAAGVLYAFHEGETVQTALQYGSCVAAASLSGSGASEAVRSLRECLALEQHFGVHR